jgi:hypothetical protein
MQFHLKLENLWYTSKKEFRMSINAKMWCALAAALLLPITASAEAILINSTCVVGTCPPGPTDVIGFGQSIGPITGSYSLMFPNSDTYSVGWSFSASYSASGTEIVADPVVTYAGLAPSLGDDVITLHFYANYYDSSSGSWDGAYTETIPLELYGNVGAGSTVSAELYYGGQGIGLVGPYGLGYHFTRETTTLTGLTGDTLPAEFVFNFNFEAGTETGSGGSASPVPEPCEALPLGLALGCIVWVRLAARRRSRYTQ